jgi:epsin
MSNIIWANLDTDGKSWKQIFKVMKFFFQSVFIDYKHECSQTLTLIDFLIKNGSERFIEASRDKLYRIRTLQDYNFYEGTVDKGSGVREKAKSLIEMLGNNEVIRSERDKARQLRNKFVGIDSRNAGGGGGGGIYGGNFYDNNGGVSSNNGGGNGNHNNNNGTSNSGRYGGGPSYDINGRYGDQGIYSQSSNDRRGSQVTNHSNVPSRFGGGAYDSDHPPRYGDDIPVTKCEDESSSIILPTAPIGGGKLKISIKKATLPVAVSIQNVVAAPEIDLFGDSGDVDLMYVGPATAASHGGNILFDAFSSAASATPLHQTSFDPFDNRAPPTAPINNCGAPAFDPFGAVPSAPCDACAAQPLVQSFDPFAVVHQPFPPFHRQQQPFFALHTPQTTPASVTIALNRTPSNTSHTSQQQSHETEFGDFEIAPQQQQQKSALTPIASKWGDLGKLVDLSSIGKNEVQAKLSAAGTDTSNNNHQSGFAGLDGYSKTVYNMVSVKLMSRCVC